MQNLPKIEKKVIGAVEVNAVNARDLHGSLGVKKKFADWINHQINTLGLETNVDYVVIPLKGKNPKGGRPEKEYLITLDAAKHISMASRTAKGKEVRNYFIAIEKKYQAELTSPNEMMMQFMQNQQAHNEMVLKILATMQDQIAKQEQKQIANALTPTQLDEIKRAVMKATKPLAECHNLEWGEATRKVYTELNGRMGVFAYYHISPRDFDEAMALLTRMKQQKEEQLATGEVKTFLSVNVEVRDAN